MVKAKKCGTIIYSQKYIKGYTCVLGSDKSVPQAGELIYRPARCKHTNNNYTPDYFKETTFFEIISFIPRKNK